MKNIHTIALVMLCLACSKSEEPKSEKELILDKLMAKSWVITEAKVDDVFATGAFSNLRLNFTGTAITVENPVAPIWQNSSFILEKVGSQYLLLRSDNIEVTIEELNENILKTRLQYSAINLKNSSISGSYIFEFEGK